MHNAEARNLLTGQIIPCFNDKGRLYFHGGEDCEPVRLGQQWVLIQDYSWVRPLIAVLTLIGGIIVWPVSHV